MIKLRLHVFLSNDLFKSKGSFFHMQPLVFLTNGLIGVPMINVDASAGKRRADD